MDIKELLKNKDLILPWMADDESRFIFEKRCDYSESGNYKSIRDIAERYIPEYRRLKAFYETLEGKKIWIWGAGFRLGTLMKYMDLAPSAEICGIIDNSDKKANTFTDFGVKISKPSDVDFAGVEYVVITVKSRKIINEIIAQLNSYGIETAKILVFLDYYGYETEERQYFDELIEYGDDETFIDAGVYDLGTTFEFFEHCAKHNVKNMKCIAFEPDPASFDRCQKIVSEHPDFDIDIVKSALYSHNTTLSFMSTSDVMSRLSSESSVCVTIEKSECISVDAKALDTYTDEKITFIKMDIEGAELEALKGCERTIKQYKPKLAICVYHKPEDIIEIPMYIKSICPDYKLYLRHYGNFEFDTVLYALPY